MSSRDQTRFVILTQSRSGSTLLVQALDAHPDVTCEGELLEFHVDESLAIANRHLRAMVKHPPVRTALRFAPRRYIELRASFSSRACYGFKLFPWHLRLPHVTLAGFVRHGWRVIHLVRDNVFDQALSMLVGARTQYWHRRAADEPNAIPRVEIDPAALLRDVRRRLAHRKVESAALRRVPHLALSYERDLVSPASRAAALDRVARFLDIAPRSAATTLEKTYPMPYAKVVSNYAQLVDQIRRSAYREFVGS